MLVAGLIVLVVIVFGVFILVFQRVMRRYVTSATSQLEQMNDSYTRKEQEAEARLAEAQAKAEEFVQQAQAQAQAAKDEIIKSAQGEKEALIQQAREQAEEIMRQADKARQQLLGEVEQRIDKQALKKACLLVQHSLPDDFKKDVHEKWVNNLLESGFESLEQVKLPENEKEVRIASAFDLTVADKAKVTEKLTERLGKEIQIKTETDPCLIAGIMISIGSLVLDGTLKQKIQEKAR